MITSVHNPKIQQIRALQSRSRQRREAGAFVVEGVRLVEEAFQAGWETELVLYTEDLGERGQVVVKALAAQGVQVEQAAPHVFRAASDTQSPQGILAVLPIKTLPLPAALDFAFIPDGVRDPGNLGTMLRTAAAAGAQAVFLPPGSVDAFAPKVVRAAMGAHFRLPIYSLTWDEVRQQVRQAPLWVYLAEAGLGEMYTQADFRRPLALMIGSEAEGASQEGRSLVDTPVHIPMPGGGESLNAAIAAAVLLFEVARQRTIAHAFSGQF
ncbi:MAG TPA: RNA methyltransferase [Anaerolineales bacterium]